MKMHRPPHPGEFIREIYLDPFGLSCSSVAVKLKVSASTFTNLVKGKSRVTPEMALRLSKTLGRTAESWLIMQNNYNLWHARKRINLDEVEALELLAA
ncbi:MAG: addiction module antidote protein, HigA family [Candidatus Cloacimonetes bacterium 4572_55]|nr:MAG: addiction module antidote protein, HigA family [Candidatus Cloacimonetes bacterium 4572_55]